MNTVIDLLHEGARKYGPMPYLGRSFPTSTRRSASPRPTSCPWPLPSALGARGIGPGTTRPFYPRARVWVIGEFGLLKAGCASVRSPQAVGRGDPVPPRPFGGQGDPRFGEQFLQAVEAIGSASRKPLVVCISERTPSLEQEIAASGLSAGGGSFFLRRSGRRRRGRLAGRTERRSPGAWRRSKRG
jgi:hypothetical protein